MATLRRDSMLELAVEGYVLIDNWWDNIKMALKRGTL
jgi:hypothetical protein